MTEGVVSFKAEYLMLIMAQGGNNGKCVQKAAKRDNYEVRPNIKQDRFAPI